MSRVRLLFRRYALVHYRVARTGFDIPGRDGTLLGRVEVCERRGDRLHLAGWACGARVALEDGVARREVAPAIWRQDVADHFPGRRAAGFEVDFPAGAGPLRFSVEGGGKTVQRDVPGFSRRAHLAAELRTRTGFALALVWSLPAILRWALWRDAEARASVKRALGLEDPAPGGWPRVRPGLFQDTAAPAAPPTPVTLVMPVYNAFDLTREALARIRANTDLPWHLILVDDASSDGRVRPFLRRFRDKAPPGAVTLIENAENLGFVGSANRGLAEARRRGDHVILVNSDAMVPPGWASRLIAPILANPRVASVTPMSNDAEIFTVPVICRPAALGPGEAEAIDAAARRIGPRSGLADAPTGVGFCMAMNIAFLRRVPAFDTVFGRGYGEEVDWCRRVRAAGGRHLCQPGLFVEHRGGQSFGSEKARLVAEHNAIIARRYRGYDAEVQDFIGADPLGDARLALGIALAAARQEMLDIYIAHCLGGGAEMDLARRLREATGSGGGAVVLRVGGPALWRVELHLPEGVTRAETDEWGDVEQFLAPVSHRRIIYSNGVGYPDPVTLPDRIMALHRGEDDRIEILFHDFFPLSPSYCLLASDGRYHGVPEAGNGDSAHQARRRDGRNVPLGEWREAWGRLLRAAERITVFAESGRTVVAKAYPCLADRIAVRPHRPLHVPERGQPPALGVPVVGVLGNIGWQKGIGIVADLGRSAASEAGEFGLVVIGNTDPAHPVPARVRVHGTYRPDDLPRLVARYGITLWLIPSIWPETFSFTAREALATGIPTYAFDLGGQGEAMREGPNGHAVPFDPDAPHADVLISAWRRDGWLKRAVQDPWHTQGHRLETRSLPSS